MKTILRNSFFLFLFLSAFPVFSLSGEDLLYQAGLLEKEKKYSEALNLFESWLKENRTDSAYKEILFRGASLLSDVNKSITFLLEYGSSLEDSDKVSLYTEVARLYEISFRPGSASDYYLMAYRESPPVPRQDLFLKYLKLRYQSGEIPGESQLDILLDNSVPLLTRIDAYLFKAEILKNQSLYKEAIDLLSRVENNRDFPALQYMLWDLYRLDGSSSSMKEILQFMKKNYPGSVELALMEGEVQRVPRLSDFFAVNSRPETSPERVFAQVGAFSSEENSLALIRSLEEDGFYTAKLSDGGKIKVLAGDDLSPAELLDRLNKKGYSGFIVEYP